MRKATKVLLLLSEIFSFICIGILLIYGLTFIALATNIDELSQFIAEEAGEVYDLETLKEVFVPLYIVEGSILAASGLICIPSAILSMKVRKSYIAGGEKKDFKKKAIALIVLGAFSMNLCVVSGIFLLAQKEENFKD